MVKNCFRAALIWCFGLAIFLLLPGTTYAHILLDSPNGGETLAGGFSYPIDWHVIVQHNTNDWDLEYSTTSSTGPWTEIVSDLPKGDISGGAPHSFNWYVPNNDISNAWVRVRQDNGGQDYDSVSTNSFSIAAAQPGDFTGNGLTNSADLLLWEEGFGTSSAALFSDGDDDSDGDVDGIDFLRWQRNHLGGSAFSATVGIPEPSTAALSILGLIVAASWRRRSSR